LTSGEQCRNSEELVIAQGAGGSKKSSATRSA